MRRYTHKSMGNKTDGASTEYRSSGASPTFLHFNLTDAVARISHPPPPPHPESFKPIHHAFIIGGATLYTESLALPQNSTAFVDRVLLTRILDPEFEDCDVFMPDFLSSRAESGSEAENTEEGGQWDQAPHEELSDWVGFEVPKGVQEEKGVKYEFQLWVRRKPNEIAS